MDKVQSTLILSAALALAGSVLTSREAIAQAGGPKVTIGDPLPLAVRNVDEAKRTPYQVDLDCTGAFGGCPAGYSVPTGKRLVIGHVSARVRVAQGSQAEMALLSGLETSGDTAAQVRPGQ